MTVDPYLWLEDITADAALEFARERNAVVDAKFGNPALRDQILDLLNTDTRIPYPTRRGEWLYNFWRDADHERGIWRRTTFEEYRKPDPEWDVILDVDALAAADDENWVWAGAAVLRPSQSRALIHLSRGGGDAIVIREFDMATRSFVDDGFTVPEAKTRISWIDEDTVYIGSDFGEGSLTDSGYPRFAKKWHRGTPLTDAETVFEAEPSDVSCSAGYDRTPGYESHYVVRSSDFFNADIYLLTDAGLTKLDVPTDASVDWHKDWMTVRPKTAWTTGGRTFDEGSLVVTRLSEFLAGKREFEVLFAPDAHTSYAGSGWTANHLLLTTLHDVHTQLHVCTPGDNGWTIEAMPTGERMTTTSIAGLDPLDGGDEFLLQSTGFTLPPALFEAAVGTEPKLLKQSPEFFDATGMVTEQFFAVSDDGTEVPYFVTRKAGISGPTIMGGYGGFENSLVPAYTGISGVAWLSKGGISVSANIRGGGEYGPNWHNQARREGRHFAFEDFAAVAKDLVARGITTHEQLGASGGSNGGLLIGVMLTRYPELFGALVCRVPLLDMRRYHKLLAGASWIGEYGDPDNPDDWKFLSEYSPYQHVDAGRAYPPVLMTTSTRDDRVHPGHARKMVARLEETGHEIWYYENIEGGHGGAANNEQAAYSSALAFEFFEQKLGL
ncbi:prolyl oligopeptidase family serine peptidase [Smaragdicoccus niigatensis]|uniref:prolyl oligopeptidase family serine peptidase n=1 Tax=Smaragdicoccus niigatensis TaxID=359359 RepID=UPI000375BCB2|nr:prolyl oligopeptidase family serine peptidase [Smaragdicoccus niigatensis]